MNTRDFFAQRYIKRYYLARLVSSFGNGMGPIVLAFGILHMRGGSPTELGWVLGCSSIAMLAMAPFGGVIADKFGRVRVTGLCDIWGSIGLYVQVAFFATGHVPVWVFLFANINFGLSWGVFWPASSGILAAICKEEALQKANALQNFISNAATIMGAAIGGIIVATLGSTTGLLIDAATFTFAGLVVLSFGHVVPQRAENENSMLDDLVHGWKVFLSYRWIVAVVAGFGFITMSWAMGENVLGPLIALKHFNGAKSWAFVLTCESIGFLVGSVIGLKIKLKYPMRFMMAITSTLAIYMWALARPQSLAIIAASAFIWGIALDLWSSVWMTAMVRQVPRESLSRVSSFDAMGSFLFRPVGLMIAAPMAAAFGVTRTMEFSASVVLIIVVLVLAVPEVRNMTMPESTTSNQ
jgi:MFS family permease